MTITTATTPAPTIWAELLGTEVNFHDVNGVRTRVISAGQGRPIVLLHGVSGSAETWTRNIHRLAQHGRVHAIDMIGHGLTDKPDTRYLMPTFTEHLSAFIEQVADEPIDLIGQSLGGWVAMRYALANPDRIRRLGSVTGAGFSVEQTKEDLERYHADLDRVTTQALEAPTRETVRKRLEWLFYDHDQVPEEMVEVRFRIFQRPDSQAVLGRVLADVIGQENQRHFISGDELRAFERPTLVLWTRHNPTTPWQEGKAAADALPNARFELIEDSAHWPQYEKHAEFNAMLDDFLGAQDA